MVCWYCCICHGHLMAHLTACCLITVQLSAPIGWNEECWLETLRNWSWGTNYETFFLVCSSVTSTWQRPKFKMSECPLKYIFQSARWGGCRMMRNHNHSQYSVFQAFTGCHLFLCAHIQLHHSSKRKLNSRQSIIPALKWNLIKLVIRLRCFLPSVCQMFLMHHHHLSATPRNFFFSLPKHCGSRASSGCPLLGAYWWAANERPIKGERIDPQRAWWQYHCNGDTIEKDMHCQAAEERGWNNHLIYCSFGLTAVFLFFYFSQCLCSFHSVSPLNLTFECKWLIKHKVNNTEVIQTIISVFIMIYANFVPVCPIVRQDDSRSHKICCFPCWGHFTCSSHQL